MNSRAMRSAVTLREATAADAGFLAGMWADMMRRGERADHVSDIETVLAGVEASDSKRIVVAEYDGRAVGAVHLQIISVSAINLTPAVLVTAPYVVQGFRRKGIGHALVDAGVTWAEENGIGSICGAATTGSRDANRWFARLGLSGTATYRIGAAPVVRERLTEQIPLSQRVPGYRPQRVLAARRVRRAQNAS